MQYQKMHAGGGTGNYYITSHGLIIILQYNWTSVMLAAKFGHDEVVKELAKRGADLTLKTVRATVHSHAFIIILWVATSP